ncbi:MAG: alpha/beta hydrolase [Aliihoeflea sp.]
MPIMNAASRRTGPIRWLLAGPARLGAAVLVFLSATGFVAGLTVPELYLYADRFRVSIMALADRDGFRPVDLETHDGLTLRNWYRAPEPGKPVIVYFPDRMGDFARKPAHLFALGEEGYGLLLASYRGYGGNPGRPGEAGFYRDARALLALAEERQLAPDGYVIYGYSMGTGVASYAATAFAPLGVILEAPFTSFADVVRYQAAPLPILRVSSQFDTRSRMGLIQAPILILAGELDQVTPAFFARQLAALNEGLATVHVFPGANHLNIIRHGAGQKVAAFLAQLKPATVVLAGNAGQMDAPSY